MKMIYDYVLIPLGFLLFYDETSNAKISHSVKWKFNGDEFVNSSEGFNVTA